MTLLAQNERNRSISHRQLMQMLYVSAGSRIFFLLVIDMPELNACVWMAPLIGLCSRRQRFYAPMRFCAKAACACRHFCARRWARPCGARR